MGKTPLAAAGAEGHPRPAKGGGRGNGARGREGKGRLCFTSLIAVSRKQLAPEAAGATGSYNAPLRWGTSHLSTSPWSNPSVCSFPSRFAPLPGHSPLHACGLRGPGPQAAGGEAVVLSHRVELHRARRGRRSRIPRPAWLDAEADSGGVGGTG